MSKQAMTLALEALIRHQDYNAHNPSVTTEKTEAAIAALKEAIKQHDAEPVAREQIVECITGAIHRHMSTPVYPREVAEAARYIVDNYLSAPSIPEGFMLVPKASIEWLKKYKSALCAKAGLFAAPNPE